MVDLGSTDYMTVLATELTGNDSDIDIATIKDIDGNLLSNLTISRTIDGVTREVTCEVCGVITYTCDICGDSYDEYVDAEGHEWTTVEATGHEEDVLVQAAWDEPVYESHC